MEINRLDDVIGAVALENLVEGLSIVTWAQSEMPMPGPLSYPSLSNGFAFRDGGFDQAQTHPFTQTVYLTYPGMQDGKTIPSGMSVVLHGGSEGVYTISSGLFVANAGLVAGAKLEALNVADDTTSAGKLNLTSTEADTVATVVRYDSVKVRLTVKSRAA